MSGAEPTRGLKILSVLWAVLIGLALIALAGSVLLPSTKRARVNVEELRRMNEERRLAAEEAAAAATTSPASPATAPAASMQP
jgi:hypothetical protein